SVARSNATSTNRCSAQATSSAESSSPSHKPSCQFAMWTIGKSITNCWHAATNRWDVVSSASNRYGASLSFTRSADFLWERLGVGQSTPDQHTRPVEMVRRLVHGFRLPVHRQDLPHGHPAAGQVRLAARQRVAERDTGELALETLLDHV